MGRLSLQPGGMTPGAARAAVSAWAAVALVAWSGVAASAQQRVDEAARALAGAIDIHVHSLPDDRERSVDALDAAIMARAHGMRAIVLKNHYESTAGMAYMVRKQVPGVEVFGGLDLNLTVGGMNPAAVEHMTRVSGGFGRIVWMSTFDAENQVRFDNQNRGSVAVSRNGELLQAAKDVIAVIAKHQLVIATGHVTPAEGLMLLREAKRVGVQKMVVTHAMNTPVSMTVPQMQEAAALGAFIEFVGGTMLSADAAARVDRFAAAIRAIGPASCILSSDLGQKNNPLPADGLAAFILALKSRGLGEQELDLMSKRNPATLLGLK